VSLNESWKKGKWKGRRGIWEKKSREDMDGCVCVCVLGVGWVRERNEMGKA
jgi:hypothetical protein